MLSVHSHLKKSLTYANKCPYHLVRCKYLSSYLGFYLAISVDRANEP